MVLCSTLGNTFEGSIEYAYTPNEIKYNIKIDDLNKNLLFASVEQRAEIEQQIKGIEELKIKEIEAFVHSVSIVTDLLKNIFKI